MYQNSNMRAYNVTKLVKLQYSNMRAEKIPFQMGVAQPLNFTQHAKYYFGYFINAALI